MTSKHLFHEEARKEFDEATDFYAMERAPLGRAFVSAVERSVVHAAEYPESGTLVRGGVRKIRVERFPYSLLYTIVDDCIRILAVAHDRRRPFYWGDRD